MMEISHGIGVGIYNTSAKAFYPECDVSSSASRRSARVIFTSTMPIARSATARAQAQSMTVADLTAALVIAKTMDSSFANLTVIVTGVEALVETAVNPVNPPAAAASSSSPVIIIVAVVGGVLALALLGGFAAYYTGNCGNASDKSSTDSTPPGAVNVEMQDTNAPQTYPDVEQNPVTGHGMAPVESRLPDDPLSGALGANMRGDDSWQQHDPSHQQQSYGESYGNTDQSYGESYGNTDQSYGNSDLENKSMA